MNFIIAEKRTFDLHDDCFTHDIGSLSPIPILPIAEAVSGIEQCSLLVYTSLSKCYSSSSSSSLSSLSSLSFPSTSAPMDLRQFAEWDAIKGRYKDDEALCDLSKHYVPLDNTLLICIHHMTIPSLLWLLHALHRHPCIDGILYYGIPHRGPFIFRKFSKQLPPDYIPNHFMLKKYILMRHQRQHRSISLISPPIYQPICEPLAKEAIFGLSNAGISLDQVNVRCLYPMSGTTFIIPRCSPTHYMYAILMGSNKNRVVLFHPSERYLFTLPLEPKFENALISILTKAAKVLNYHTTILGVSVSTTPETCSVTLLGYCREGLSLSGAKNAMLTDLLEYISKEFDTLCQRKMLVHQSTDIFEARYNNNSVLFNIPCVYKRESDFMDAVHQHHIDTEIVKTMHKIYVS